MLFPAPDKSLLRQASQDALRIPPQILELSALYAKQGKLGEAAEVLSQYDPIHPGFGIHLRRLEACCGYWTR